VDEQAGTNGRKRKQFGVAFWSTMGGFAIVLTALSVPNFVRSPHTGCKNACINNLRQLDGAKEQYMLEQNASAGAFVSLEQLTGPGSYIKQKPECPANGVYTIGLVGEKPRCTVTGHELP